LSRRPWHPPHHRARFIRRRIRYRRNRIRHSKISVGI
jgi:hypothetical protein